MFKRILALLIILLMAVPSFSVLAESEEAHITAVDGNITISCEIDAEPGTPVTIFILPRILENGEDVTLSKVKGLTSSEIQETLNIEYLDVEKVTDEGNIVHECEMKSSLSTGVCHVILNYIGSDGCYLAGSFEHVGEDDKTDLLEALNEADKDTCGPIIYDDMNGALDEDGETRLEPKEILRKSSADVVYYNSLSDETENDDEKSEKERFHELLYKLKGEASFDLPLLVDSFNKAGIWMRLSLEEDTLSVLNAYNGEGIGKYWNIAIGEGSDFSTISSEESTAILASIKAAGYSDKTLLETDFHNGVMMAMFRAVTTREELTALISADGAYGEDFPDVRDIVSSADLGEYEESQFYNNVLDGNSDCITMTDIERLFTSSVPESEDDNKGGVSPGKTNKGDGIKYENDVVVKPVVPEVKHFPFKDVNSAHWAYSYVEKLYENGTINGVSADEFSPDTSVARQDFVKILIGALGIETSKTESQFADVDNSSYYAPFVMTAFEKGIITGMGENSFGVGVSIKREDAAVIMDRVLSLYNTEVSENKSEFADIGIASGYATASIERVAAAGIFSGDENGNFNPKGNLSRAEACAILYRLAELMKEV